MKILRLNLEAFGPFTDLELDLSSGKEGFHLIYGDNEAGKSSALRALRGLLFGIPLRSADNFRHQNKELRIGARIRHSDGSELDFVRRKARKNSLVDSAGQALADTVLVPYLAGVDEDLFSTFYGISHQELVRGGQDILAAKGEVGESLFDAGMGGISLRQVMDSLDADAGDLFKVRGRNRIAELIEKFKEARSERNTLSLSTRDWAEHDEALRTVRKEQDAVIKELGRLRNDEARLERIRKSLPVCTSRKLILAELAKLTGVIVLRDSFAVERRDVLRTLKDAQKTEAKNHASLEILCLEIKSHTVQDELLQQEEAIAGLHQRLGSFRKAGEDLTGLQSKRMQLDSQANSILQELKPGLVLEEAESLRLPAARKTRIRELGNRHEALVSMLRRNEDDVKNIQAHLDRSAPELARVEDTKGTVDLERAVRLTRRAGDLDGQLARARSELRREKEQDAVDLQKLGLWSGTGEELEALPIPASETIDRYESEYADLDNGRSSVSDQIQRAEENVKKLSRQIEALQRSGPVPTDSDIERARKRREEGWALIRRAWLDSHRDADLEREFDPDHELAEAYELSVIRADNAVDHIRQDADRVAQYENLLRQRDEVEKDINAWERQRKEFDTRRAELEKSWYREWHFLTNVPRPPKEMRSWVQAQARMVEQARQIRVAARDITRTEELMQDRRSQLADCLKRVEFPMPESTKKLEDLLDHCESAISTASEIRQRRQHLETATADLKMNRDQAIQKRTEALTALEEWRSQWKPAVSELGLTQEDTPSQANIMLDRLRDLFDKLEGGESLRIRIDGIRQDADQFQANVEAMVKQVAPELVGLAASQAASQLVTRLNQAREDKAASEKLRAQEKEKQGDLREAQATIKEMKSQLDDLCREASCAVDGLEEVEEQSVRKRNLQIDLQRFEQQLLSLGDGLTIDEIIQEADGVEQEGLPTRLLEVENAVGELDRRRSRLDQAIGREETVLEDMDGNAMAAEAEEKAQSLLSEIQDCVDRFVRLRLASTILHQQIERHREQNQDPVLRRAGETFARLTLGSFANLQTDFDDRDEPVLVGIRPSGEIVSVAGMSDGTLDQLYLSLRLASLEHTLEQNEPIPLIVDDVLINFDDSRAKAALEALAEVSRKTQVICFTHHARLVALAEEALDDGVLHVHSLGAVSHQERRSVGENHEAS